MNAVKTGRGTAPVEGGEVAYLVVGDGPPVATTHPYTTPKAGHTPVPGFTTITVWPRGFGASSPARDSADYGFWRLAEDLDAVRQHLGLDRWTFWGTSMGGFVGLIYALRSQDSISALILDSTAPSHHYKDDPTSLYPKARAAPEFDRLIESPSWETLRDYFVLRSRMEGSDYPEALWAEGETTHDRNPFAYGEIMKRLEEFDTRSRLGDIRIPTLVLAGEDDLQCPPSQARLIEGGIPGSILKVYPDCGHGVIRHNPPGAHRDVAEFITAALERGE
ncbi:MAG: alpha/beta hydrolase [SAR202 cluster bacterium]|jgi:pimeloyl-ACP methyl ester carboxylesterase|nr:hypothetical protein [Chloroflexota bacterium]MDP6421421.1 alpha/beta hydrolase [SAR202 cluster bacterium]HAL46906.1 hypothetical protein [Dehalococcoidia bacterium]MDP6664797.1 alpha/beta hydrolase [SAR202 cluster bacterium]MDP6799289.1 alpha/beta hydrolase [SAR202 cluster bacterium]|tara:strand:+ start:7247 stop:8077 length:831 start_codon:yes stop_codon:yes gene_type:complete